MKLHPLEFEKPIVELQEKLSELKQHSRATDINIDAEVRRMEAKIDETKRQIYQNLTAWERVQIARHPARPYALDYLQLWDCLSYDITVIKKAQLQSMRCKFKLKNGDWMYGVYLFTVDSAHPDFNILDTGFSEDIEDHKSYNFIMCDNGQFAAQPNNRLIILEPSSNPKELKMPDFRVATKRWSVETDPKWALGNTNTVMYEVK